MKRLNTYLFVLLIGLTSLLTTSCSKDNTDTYVDPLNDTHFDIWASIGGNSGMGAEYTQLAQGVNFLDKQEEIDFKGKGTDVTAKLYQESIIKGKYYYQIPREKDRFGKYQIVNGEIKIIKEVKFSNNTLKDRRYTHAWISNDTLVLIGSNGPSDKVLWIKINTDEMKICSEGELNLPAPPTGDKFNTSGIANFRKSDGKILYSYLYNYSKTHFFVAFINPKTMKTEANVEEQRAAFMAGTAYGELLQNKTFFDEKGDYYIACNNYIEGHTSRTQQKGTIVRIKKGKKDFDKSYIAYKGNTGKIITVDCLKNGKALVYIQDPVKTNSEWGNHFNCYYAILDLTTNELTELDLPYSQGTFSQRSIVLGNKAYIGVNPENESPAVYIYDIKTGKLTKGLTITEGYSFDRIVVLKD